MESPDDLTFTRVLQDGKPWWLMSNGRLVPQVRGGSGDDDGDGEDGDDNGDDSGGDDAGDDDKGDKGGKGDAFDPERSASALKKKNRENASLRGRLKELEPLAAELQALKDKDKTETQRLTDERDALKTAAETSAAAHMRLEVALDKAPEGMPLAKVKQLAKRLTGKTIEELEADADELFGEFATSQEDGGGKSQEDNKGNGKSGRPKEKLRSGAVSSAEPDETDPKKLAALVQRR